MNVVYVLKCIGNVSEEVFWIGYARFVILRAL